MRHLWSYLTRFQFVRFLISGGTGAMVHFFVLYLLTGVMGVWYLLATSIAFTCAFFVSFTLQKHWTYTDRSPAVWGQRGRYFLIGVGNLLLNGALMYVLVDGFGIWYLLAQVIASGLIAVLSHLLYRTVVFMEHGERREHPTKENTGA